MSYEETSLTCDVWAGENGEEGQADVDDGASVHFLFHCNVCVVSVDSTQQDRALEWAIHSTMRRHRY